MTTPTGHPTASHFYGWFKNHPNDKGFMARCIDTSGASWRIDEHDETFFLALPASLVRLATQEEITKHINRKTQK